MSSSADEDGGEADGDGSAVEGRVAHSGRRATFEEDFGRAHGDGVRGANADGEIAHARGGQTADQNGGGAGTNDRSTHVWYRGYTRCLHGADVHVGQSCGWLWHDDSVNLFDWFIPAAGLGADF